MLSTGHILMPYIPFSGVNDSAHVPVTRPLTNLDRPSVPVQPKPSDVQNQNAKNKTEKHVSHLHEIANLVFLASIPFWKN